MQSDAASIIQSGNLYMYTMHNPVMWVDPSGLRAYSARNRGEGGRYTLLVSPHSYNISIDILSIPIPFSNLAIDTFASWAGLREIRSDWNAVVNAMQDIGGTLSDVSSFVSAASIVSTIFDQERFLREGIYNTFHHSVWHSDSRDTVDDRFNFAMVQVSALVTVGGAQIMRAEDFFGAAAFRDSDTITATNPLVGPTNWSSFHRNNYYIFPTETFRADGFLFTIQRATENIGR